MGAMSSSNDVACRHAGGSSVVDAFEDSRLAARRPGAPICGNRVWTKGTGINIPRGTSTETLATAYERADTIRSAEAQQSPIIGCF